MATLMAAGTLPAHAATIDAPEANLAVVDGDGDLRLSWQPTPGASAYRVEVATTAGFDAGTVVAAADTYALTWVPTSVLASGEARTLYWHVAAYSSGTTVASRGGYSEAQTFDTDAMAVPVLVSPGSPSGGTVTYPTPVTFVWQPVPGAVSYDVQYSPDSTFPTEVSRPVENTTGTSWTLDLPLERTVAGETIVWNWRVRANFYSGTSTALTGRWSPGSRFTVEWPAAASKPTLLSPASWTSPTDPAVSDVVFTWSPVPGAASYKVVVGVAKNDAGTAIAGELANAGGTTTSTTLVPEIALLDQNYYWQVVAYDTAGRPGVPSDIRQFQKQWGGQTSPTVTVGAPSTYPVPTIGAPSVENAPEIDLNSFQLSWQPVPRATMYEVQVVPLNGDPRLTCRTASTSVTVIEEVDPGAGLPSAQDGAGPCLWTAVPTKRIQAGATYRWRVRAIDLTGAATTLLQSSLPTGTVVSDWSDPEDAGLPARARYVKVVAPPAATATGSEPDEAAFAAATTDALKGQPSPVFSWNATIGATGYEVRFATNSAMTTQIAVVRTQGTVLRLNGVFDDNTTGLPYYWQVRPFKHVSGDIVYIADGSASHPSWVKNSRATDLVGVVNPVSVSSDGTTVLSWRPQGASAPLDGGARGYQISILNSDGTLLAAKKIEYPSYVAQNPANGKPLPDGNYKFTVAPLDANGNPGRVFEPARDFTVETPRPVLAAAQAGTSSLALRWSTPAAVARYEVEYWNTATPTATTKVAGVSLVKQTGLTVKDLAPGTYGWRVRSVDSANGVSQWSTVATAVVATRAPELITGDAVVLPTSARVLDWEPVPGASRYIVQWATSSGAVASAVGVETVASSLAVPSAVTFGATYWWRVRAVSEKYSSSTGTSRVSLGTSVERTFSTRTTPGAPVGTAVTVNGRDLTVSWTQLTTAASGTDTGVRYVVRYRASATPENAWVVLSPTTAGAASMVLTGLQSSTTYEVAVSALTAEGQGQWSSTATRATAGPPGAPTGLVFVSGAGTLKVTWRLPTSTGGTPLTGVTLRYQRTAESSWTTVPLLPSTTTYTITGLVQNTDYRVEVTAENAVGSGPAAAAQSTVAGLPGSPVQFAVTRGDRFATVTWAPPASDGGSAITGYALEMRTYSSSTATWSAWAVKSSPASTARSATVTSLVNGTTYEFRLSAKTAIGTGAPTKALRVQPSVPSVIRSRTATIAPRA
ncbi:fibronectin type III domain-containing protein [uncultured Cellulomonas sp.]|uniref:fibronectin type III domain-containing protein n=1 Tax=uncultured Cellulomonas sp. TaxID=189682 RepID=UPI0028EE5DDC|nr:fibronectin type III domain-containing protein [uncultured Cellulomonas sp.]